jgi:hypothetical protein
MAYFPRSKSRQHNSDAQLHDYALRHALQGTIMTLSAAKIRKNNVAFAMNECDEV